MKKSHSFTTILLLFIISIHPTYSQYPEGRIQIITGPEEPVFEYVNDHCVALDLPDVYAHAIRTERGIMLVSGNAPDNYFMFGENFDRLKRSCDPVLMSGDSWPVETFDHQEWITSVYSEDGTIIHALVHNEYHDPYSRKCKPGITDPSNPCWYNYISYAKSTDGGRTFTQPPSPDHLVAMLPFRWNPDAAPRGAPPPHGYFEPSNIVKHNGYYYCIMFGLISNTDMGRGGTCIMRTDDIGSPGSWKILGDDGFTIPLINPYTHPPADSSIYFPTFISNRTIRDLRGSLTWNTYLGKFMLAGAGVHPIDGVETCGFFYSLSDDLIEWSQPQLLRETILGWSPCNVQTPDQAAGNIVQEAYPSIIDHDAPDRSFTLVDSTAYLYFMRNMDNWRQGGWGLRRDLVRIPIRFVKGGTTTVMAEESSKKLVTDNHPNPFSSDTAIRWRSSFAADTRLVVLDVLGRTVATLVDGFRMHGEHTVRFDGEKVAAGLYFYQLRVGNHVATKMMMIVK